MKRKVVVAMVGLMLILSSVISVAGLRAFVRDYTRADYLEALAMERMANEYAARFAQAIPQAPPAPRPERAEPAPRPQRDAPPPPPTLPIDAPRDEDQFPTERDWELYARSRNAFRLGQDLTLGPNDIVRDAAVVFGDAVITGRVTGNLVVVFGTATIAKSAVIDGDFVSIGGRATVEEGAIARRDVVVIGGPLEAPASFAAAGGQIVIGSGILGGSLEGLVPYLSRGLAWGRVIVPDLPWVWGIVAIFFLIYAAINLIFERPVRTCAATLRDRPMTTFGTGMLVLLLFGPICVLLVFSVIGIVVLPFLVCALIAGAILGKVAVARFIGTTAIEEDPDGNRAHAARSFVIGFATLTIAYMIPLVGIVAWSIVAVLGLGSAFLSLMSAYRRENPGKPPVMVTPPPAPPMGPPPAPGYGTAPPAGATAFDGSPASIPTAPPPFQAPQFQSPSSPAYAAPGAYAFASPALLAAQPRALFRDRMAAFLVDVIVVLMVVAFFSMMDVFDGPEFFPLLLIYLIVCWTWKQTTIGGILCQIRLVRVDGTPLSFADALVRALAGIFSLLPFGIGAFWILRDPERQAWHDKIAGTYVVKVPRAWAI